MSARDWLYRRLVDAGTDPEVATAALDAYKSKVLVQAAGWFEQACPEVDSLIPLCLCDAAPELRKLATAAQTETGRLAVLLDAIREDPHGRWKTDRALHALRAAGIHPISPGTASRLLTSLAATGHLTRHENEGCRWYETRRPNTEHQLGLPAPEQ